MSFPRQFTMQALKCLFEPPEGDLEQSAQIYQGKLCLIPLKAFHDEVNRSVDVGTTGRCLPWLYQDIWCGIPYHPNGEIGKVGTAGDHKLDEKMAAPRFQRVLTGYKVQLAAGYLGSVQPIQIQKGGQDCFIVVWRFNWAEILGYSLKKNAKSGAWNNPCPAVWLETKSTESVHGKNWPCHGGEDTEHKSVLL